MLDGKRHLVVPLVAMVQGVHHGSGGPALYLEEDFAEYVSSWNGVPLPVMHPSVNGEMMSANTPDVINNQSVGRFFNARIEDHKLKGEAWIDIEKAKAIAPEILEIINNNGKLQISTSHWSEDDFTPGVWNDEAYDAIVHNIRPDHIALLPGVEGACSWEDGCGIRANVYDVRTYRSWDNMIQRCTNSNSPDYARYGGRGIRVTQLWKDSFQNFLTDMGVRPEGKTLERKNVNAWYTPGNCKWADPVEQANNRNPPRKTIQQQIIAQNKEKGGEVDLDVTKLLELTEENITPLEEEGRKDGAVLKKIKGVFLRMFGAHGNELSHDDIREKLGAMVDGMDVPFETSPGKIHFVKEVYDDSFVYEVRQEGQPPKLFTQEFAVNAETDIVELKGQPKPVREETNYVALSEEQKQNKKEDEIMKREEAVQALIANKGNAFCDQDKDFLMKLEDDQFDKIKVLSRPVEKTADEIAAEKVETDRLAALEQKKINDKKKADEPQTTEQFLANAPAEVRESVEAGLKMIKDKKDSLITGLMANKANKFTKEALETKPVEELENLAALAHVEPDYVGGAGSGYSVPKINERAPDGSGVPKVKKMKWNKDGSPDYDYSKDKEAA